MLRHLAWAWQAAIATLSGGVQARAAVPGFGRVELGAVGTVDSLTRLCRSCIATSSGKGAAARNYAGDEAVSSCCQPGINDTMKRTDDTLDSAPIMRPLPARPVEPLPSFFIEQCLMRMPTGALLGAALPGCVAHRPARSTAPGPVAAASARRVRSASSTG